MDEKLKDAVASLTKDSGKRDALAQMIVEYVNPNHIGVDFIGMLLNTRALQPGDQLVRKMRKGIHVRTLVPGAIHLKDEITVSERMNYVLDGAVVSVGASAWELDSGELGTVSEIRSEMLSKLRDFYFGKVFTSLSTLWTAGNNATNFTDVGAPITAAALKNAIDYINQTTGGVKAVIGTRAALTPITTFGASWSDGSNAIEVPDNVREIMQTGWLGRYYGAPLLAVEQVYDNLDDYNTMIPTDKIVVIGQNVGEFITYGDIKYQEWTDPRPIPPYWTLSLFQNFAMMIDKAEGIFVLKVS
ncbi:TPA: hypothetical protein DCQ22_00035 [Candidatus Nomurabacteria bacterium]|nr:hypothetical protein [Candidatus Nomurabacteria bacterium]